jgi:hypothetical protein
MTLDQFLYRVSQAEDVSFDDAMAVIAAHYHYQPTEFNNGLGDDAVLNPAGTNEGSCKIFAFAKLHNLNQQQTLNLFGDYYRIDVLQSPEGTGHQNIRNFMRYGWEGIQFKGKALALINVN